MYVVSDSVPLFWAKFWISRGIWGVCILILRFRLGVSIELIVPMADLYSNCCPYGRDFLVGLDDDGPDSPGSGLGGLKDSRVVLSGHSSLLTIYEASSYPRQSSHTTCGKHEHLVMEGYQTVWQRKVR